MSDEPKAALMSDKAALFDELSAILRYARRTQTGTEALHRQLVFNPVNFIRVLEIIGELPGVFVPPVCSDSCSGIKPMSEEQTSKHLSVHMSECCADWPIQIHKVEGPIVLQSVRSGGRYKYDGIPFRFCPWCGKERLKSTMMSYEH